MSIGGVPLAFANVVPRGDIGIVGASGTGMQEVSTLIARHGGGVAHAIGLQLEGEVEMFRGKGLEVVRAVEPCRGVEARADPLEDAGHRPTGRRVEPARPLEHPAFEQMGGAGMPHRLVARADVVDDARGHHRRRLVGEQEHPQAVAHQFQFLNSPVRRDVAKVFAHPISLVPLS